MKGILTKWLNHKDLGDRFDGEEEWSREVEILSVSYFKLSWNRQACI